MPVSIPFQAAALVGAAGLCALVSNAFAGSSRHLGWIKAPVQPVQVLPVQEPPQVPTAPLPSSLPPPALEAKAPPKPAPAPKVEARPEAPSATALAPTQPVREITSTDAFDHFKKGAAFLDARRSAEFEAGHIQGAWCLPIWESAVDERLVEFEAKANVPPEAPLVLYCGGGECQDSHMLAARLFQMGYRNLLIYRDGYPDWVAQGRPVGKGARR